MLKYDDIVVGSGISGLTSALLMAKAGHKVLLLEKAPQIGGSLSRFYRQGVPFDTGFHFTGAFCEKGILKDMLLALGLADAITPTFLSEGSANRFIFEAEDKAFELPIGMSAIRQKIKDYFPSEKRAVDSYFDIVLRICSGTTALDLGQISFSADMVDEDYLSLQEVLDRLTDNRLLKALLCGFSMCYGVKPQEISFADHCRMCVGIYESVARVKDGGDAFVSAFKSEIEKVDVDIQCGTYITECLDVKNDHVGRVLLNTGEEVEFDKCILSIHPSQILDILPKSHLSKAFIERVSEFESSAGFFSVFGVMDHACDEDKSSDTITSLLPSLDVNMMLDPDNNKDSALVVLRSEEIVRNETRQVLTAFEPSFLSHVKEWVHTTRGDRPQEYYEYKQKRADRIVERMLVAFPHYRDNLKILDTASVLTYRDYLNSPDGSAYGIKQKVGQYNLVGKLPLKNMYAIGQSSVLPGVVGAMLSSFFAGRAIFGVDKFSEIIAGGLRR